MTIDGREVKFMRSDGTIAEGSVGCGGITEDGEVLFYEILDLIRPRLAGKEKYQRIVIRRVYPVMEVEDA